MKKRLPRKIKKASRSISVSFIPEVIEEKHSGNERAIIIDRVRPGMIRKLGKLINWEI